MAQTGQSEAIHSPEACASTVREINDAGGLVDRRGLYCGDLMLAQRFANDIESTRERGITKRLLSPGWPIRTDGRRPAISPG